MILTVRRRERFMDLGQARAHPRCAPFGITIATPVPAPLLPLAVVGVVIVVVDNLSACPLLLGFDSFTPNSVFPESDEEADGPCHADKGQAEDDGDRDGSATRTLRLGLNSVGSEGS
jgi:hypothetical protein